MTKVFCLLLVLGLIALTQQYRHKRAADTRKYGIGIGSNWQQKRAVGNRQLVEEYQQGYPANKRASDTRNYGQ